MVEENWYPPDNGSLIAYYYIPSLVSGKGFLWHQQIKIVKQQHLTFSYAITFYNQYKLRRVTGDKAVRL